MKKILTIVLIVLSISTVFAQDLIVTTQNDSLNCRIMKIEREFIYFFYHRSGEAVGATISRNETVAYQLNYFAEPELSDWQIAEHFSPPVVRWRIALRGGYSRWLSFNENIPEDMTMYINNLKNGFCIGTDVNYFFNSFVGIGIKYTCCNHRSQDYYKNMKDNCTGHFIAPDFMIRIWDCKHKDAIIWDVAAGYLSLYDKEYDATKRAGTIGVSLGLGYERALNKNVAIGGGISCLVAVTHQIEVSENGWRYMEEYDDSIRFNYFDVGLRLVFNAFGK